MPPTDVSSAATPVEIRGPSIRPDVHGVPDGRSHAEDRVGIHDRCDAGQEELGQVVRGDQGGQRGVPVEEQLVVGPGFSERQVAVGVDQAGHDRAAGGVDPGDVARVPGPPPPHRRPRRR